ncbi:50S ribosomal protein L18 [Patescibacteria group bacterium]|nr:50S ribosomal protein L18 [Patescibacteria group bacterium]MBU1663114.1 50S ribosomal protein L18 [Patescibacteria group bacterium]MBU1933701.1 50S ribosomal protein L18 [Patescibacteria group bacterium]MBU2008013.1 50S ribosomal protein L18 [Patescibacteria group bacterium]MBU2233698.1 50S ribosomal protein L18 [Patescibacteria group bacterium]
MKQNKRLRRKGRVRAKISGTAVCPRLSVFRSNCGIYAQIINDEIGTTLVSVSANEVKIKDKKIAVSLELGKLLAAKAMAKGINHVVFDRNGYKYHGRVKALAQGAREGGLKF